MKMKPRFPLKEGREPKREERREAAMSKKQMKRAEAAEGQHLRRGGKVGKGRC